MRDKLVYDTATIDYNLVVFVLPLAVPTISFANMTLVQYSHITKAAQGKRMDEMCFQMLGACRSKKEDSLPPAIPIKSRKMINPCDD